MLFCLMLTIRSVGNLPELFQSQAAVPDFKWQRQFGDIVRIKGALGEDRLFVSDPKAMQYIFQTAGTELFPVVPWKIS